MLGSNRQLVPKSVWQEKAGFVQEKARKTQQRIEEGFLPPQTALPESEGAIPANDGAEGQERAQHASESGSSQQLEQESDETTERHEANSNEPEANQHVRRSNRERRPPARAADYIPHENIAFEALLEPENVRESEFDEIDPIVAMKATSDPDTMYLWQAMKEPDFDKFKKAMEDEIADHIRLGNRKIVLQTDVPDGCAILQAVWSMKCKRALPRGKYTNTKHG